MDARFGGRDGARLKRFDELVGEHAGLLGQIAGADPILGVNCVVGLRQEVANFLNQVVLRFIELFAFGALKILLGVGDVSIGALFGGGLRLRSELGRDDWRLRPRIVRGFFRLGRNGRRLLGARGRRRRSGFWRRRGRGRRRRRRGGLRLGRRRG